MKMSTPSIACTDIERKPTHHCSPGAVMESKSAKVFAINKTGAKIRQPKDPDKFIVKKDIDNFPVLIDIAIPCGLMLNELITKPANIIKLKKFITQILGK